MYLVSSLRLNNELILVFIFESPINDNNSIVVYKLKGEKDKLSSLITGNKVHFKWNYGLEHLFSKQTSMNLISEK